MNKKITGIILIILGSIPFIMRALPRLALGPAMRSGRMGMPNGNFPSGRIPQGGPPGGEIGFGLLGTLNSPYILIIGIVFIIVGIILLTHKEQVIKKQI
jgi:hypothetical protein